MTAVCGAIAAHFCWRRCDVWGVNRPPFLLVFVPFSADNFSIPPPYPILYAVFQFGFGARCCIDAHKSEKYFAAVRFFLAWLAASMLGNNPD